MSAELEQFLKEKLPVSMLPAAIVLLPALPLLPTGKVDRRALPDPDWKRPDPDAEAPPLTPIESMLVEIWAEVLGRGRVGRDDNFFHLGGHSLLATQLLARVHRDLRVDVPLRCLFEAPTVARFALVLLNALMQRASPAVLDGLLADTDAGRR